MLTSNKGVLRLVLKAAGVLLGTVYDVTHLKESIHGKVLYLTWKKTVALVRKSEYSKLT